MMENRRKTFNLAAAPSADDGAPESNAPRRRIWIRLLSPRACSAAPQKARFRSVGFACISLDSLVGFEEHQGFTRALRRKKIHAPPLSHSGERPLLGGTRKKDCASAGSRHEKSIAGFLIICNTIQSFRFLKYARRRPRPIATVVQVMLAPEGLDPGLDPGGRMGRGPPQGR